MFPIPVAAFRSTTDAVTNPAPLIVPSAVSVTSPPEALVTALATVIEPEARTTMLQSPVAAVMLTPLL